MRDEDRGLIRYDPAQVRVERLIAQVAEGYPKARILVVASRQNDVLYLHRQIRLRELPAGRAYYNRETPGTHRIDVVTYSCVGRGLADAANRDIVFYVNPSEAFGHLGYPQPWGYRAGSTLRVHGRRLRAALSGE